MRLGPNQGPAAGLFSWQAVLPLGGVIMMYGGPSPSPSPQAQLSDIARSIIQFSGVHSHSVESVQSWSWRLGDES